MSIFLQAARKLIEHDLNAIVVDDSKRPVYPWKKFQTNMISMGELIKQLKHPKAAGLGVVCGSVSGNLEVIDFDLKYDVSGVLMQKFVSRVPKALLEKLCIVETRSKGYHIYYRCEKITTNIKLASRKATEGEVCQSPHIKQLVLIETRGQGGFVVAPPTPGYRVHHRVKVPFIQIDERETLLAIARSFNEIQEMIVVPKPKVLQVATANKPLDDYNLRGTPIALLETYGWTVVREDKERIFLKRPGHTAAESSGNFHKGKNLFKVWSTSTEFSTGMPYDPAGIYTTLVHQGNYKAAAKDLYQQGYGRTG